MQPLMIAAVVLWRCMVRCRGGRFRKRSREDTGGKRQDQHYRTGARLDRNKNQTYFGNIMYKYNPYLTFAWELRHFLTNRKGQPFANETGNHANLAIGYVF
jgi:hypothetical protein